VTVPPPITAARKLIQIARRWARSRAKLRKVLDSKSATPKVQERAQKAHVEDTHKMERAVLELEGALRSFQGDPVSGRPRRRSKPLPWKDIMSAVSMGAGIAQRVLDPEGGAPSGDRSWPPDNVIDVKANVVDK
jgi:hypothetical protein